MYIIITLCGHVYWCRVTYFAFRCCTNTAYVDISEALVVPIADYAGMFLGVE